MIQCFHSPISLLNVNYQLLASKIAERFKKCITEIIHHDETGFIPKIYIWENDHFIIDAIEYVQNKEEKAVYVLVHWKGLR